MASIHSDAQSLLLPRNVCVSSKKSTQAATEREERKGEWERVEVINIFLASLQTSSRYLNVTKSIHRWMLWKINLQADIATDGYSRWPSTSPKKLCDWWLFCDGTSDHSHNSGLSVDRSQVGQERGQGSEVQYVGRQHDHRPTNLGEGHLCRRIILSRCCMQTRQTGINDTKQFIQHCFSISVCVSYSFNVTPSPAKHPETSPWLNSTSNTDKASWHLKHRWLTL